MSKLSKEIQASNKRVRLMKLKCVLFGVILTIGAVGYYVAYQAYSEVVSFFQ